MNSILLREDKVREILENHRMVMRKVVKPQPLNAKKILDYDEVSGYVDFLCKDIKDGQRIDCVHHMRSPYKTFDILYVRETWQEVYETEVDEDTPCGFVNIRDRILNFDEIPKIEAGISRNCATATMEPRMKYYVFKASDIEYANPQNLLYWRSSTHMPHEAARIFLRVTDVRVERLQDITDIEAIKEGFEGERCNHEFSDYIGGTFACTDCMNTGWIKSPVIEFAQSWDSALNPEDYVLYGWGVNPYVWHITFERIPKKEALAYG